MAARGALIVDSGESSAGRTGCFLELRAMCGPEGLSPKPVRFDPAEQKVSAIEVRARRHAYFWASIWLIFSILR